MELAYKQDYYSVGKVDDIVISNSSLSALNPAQGGSPQNFLDFFRDDIEKKTSIQMDRGSLLHSWHEDQKRPEKERQFIVEELDKPSDMMASWCERIAINLISPSGLELECTDDLIVSTREGAYANIKDQKKLTEKFEQDGRDYLNFLKLANGKICITKETKRILDGQSQALLGNEAANRALFGDMPPNAERFIEKEIYWSIPVKTGETEGEEEGILLKYKAKIDNMVVRWDKKTVYLNDLKTTSKPVSLFKRAFISYRYYRQLSFYTTAIGEFLKQRGVDLDGWKIHPRIIAVDNTKHFNVATFDVDNKWQQKGLQEANELSNRVLWHVVNNNWSISPEESENNGKFIIQFDEKDEILNALLTE